MSVLGKSISDFSKIRWLHIWMPAFYLVNRVNLPIFYFICILEETPGLRPGNGSPMNFQTLSFFYVTPVKKIFEKN